MTAAYFMGKDNIVFHSVIWPSILLGYGVGPLTDGKGPLDLPTDIVSSEYLTMESAKFSSSRGVVIFVKDFLERYDPDPLRYYLCAAGPETQDTDFTWSEFVRRNDEELVATWGNLVNRCVSMTHKNFGALPPQLSPQPHDLELIARVEAGYDEVGALIDRTRFKLALSTTMSLAADVNRYLSDEQPWKLFESDRDRAGTVLNVGLQCVANLCTMFAPFLPFTSAAAPGPARTRRRCHRLPSRVSRRWERATTSTRSSPPVPAPRRRGHRSPLADGAHRSARRAAVPQARRHRGRRGACPSRHHDG